MFESKITFDKFIRYVIGLTAVIGVLFLLDRLSGVLLPFFIAWLVAYLIYPLVRFFQYKLRLKSRILAITCSLFILLVLGAAAIYFLIPPMIEEFGKAKDLLMEYINSGIQNTSSTVPKSLSEFIQQNLDTDSLNEYLSHENVQSLIQSIVPKLWAILSGSISVLFSIMASCIILLYIVFILLDYESISEGWKWLVPEKYRKFAQNLVSDVEVGMNRYFRGQALVSFCVGVLFCVGFLIIDFPLAIGLGLFIGALNMVPYLHVFGLIPTVLLAILKASDTGQNFWIILLSALAVFVVVQTIQDGFIVPKIMGRITGLNPAIILLSLSIWGSLLGILGMIIALPLTTLMLSYYQRFILGHEKIISPPSQNTENEQESAPEDK